MLLFWLFREKWIYFASLQLTYVIEKTTKTIWSLKLKGTLAPWPALHHVKPKRVQGFNSFKNREMKDQRMILRGKKYLRSRLSSLFMSTLRLLRMLTPRFFQIRRE